MTNYRSNNNILLHKISIANYPNTSHKDWRIWYIMLSLMKTNKMYHHKHSHIYPPPSDIQMRKKYSILESNIINKGFCIKHTPLLMKIHNN